MKIFLCVVEDKLTLMNTGVHCTVSSDEADEFLSEKPIDCRQQASCIHCRSGGNEMK